ncbi:alginate lyase family protein [Bacillus sp. FJAT-47783]|uniref:alginate lyase family protein n=1 Tax=Bacillus sp. FJAT-47783 TaxID=2922712 RepID=UPI001FAB5DFC|nr:alginate lyase family protein [Bacillus sp. FJAT-47783]
MRIKKIIKTIQKIGLKRALAIINEKYLLTPYLFIKYKTFYISDDIKYHMPNFQGIKHDYMINQDIYSQSNQINDILNNKYKLLGVEFENPNLDWNIDFKTKFVWENSFYKYIKLKSYEMNKDAKFPLEYSRLNHLLILCLYYKKNNNTNIYNKIISQLENWRDHNPMGFGISWACNMDVALRAVNLVIISKELLNDKSTSKEREFFNTVIYSHGIFIKDNLENKNLNKNNHYLSNLLGLLFVGLYFSNINFGKSLLDFAIHELESEIKQQTNLDGTNYEGSTYYHKFTFEILFYAMVIIENNGLTVSETYKSILENMYHFLKTIVKPNNEIPLIGDCDNGYVLNLNNYFCENARKSISIINIYEKHIQERNAIKHDRKDCKKNMSSFVDGGVYIMKNNKAYLLIKCGRVGTNGFGGHSHNDQLSFELNVSGKDFFVDPGTAYYYGNHQLRNENRQTKSHNTLYYEDYEQNDFQEHEIFLLKEQTYSKCIKFDEFIFIGEHYGYLKKNGNTHNRKLELQKDKVLVTDKLTNLKDSPKLSYILHPNVELFKVDEGLLLRNDGVEILLETQNYSLEECIYCYEYGSYKVTTRISLEIKRIETSTTIKFNN